MAYTPLTLQRPTRAGLNASFTAPSGTGTGEGYKLPGNSGSEMLHVKNGGGAPVTVSLLIPKQVDGQTVAARTVSVPASGERLIGPFPTADYNQGDGAVNVEVSATTSVTAAWIKSF